MNTDFRVCCSFANHYKTQKLIRRVGLKGPACLVFLWSHVAECQPSGDISGMTAEDIAIASKWDDDPDKFVALLIEIGFLETVGDRLMVHEWDIHNGYASAAVMRRECSRKAAATRWQNRTGQTPQASQEKCASNADAMREHSASTAGAMPLSSPLVTNSNAQNAQKSTPSGFAEFWDAYPRKLDKQRAVTLYRARIKEGATPDELLTAAQNYIATVKDPAFIRHPTTFLNADWRQWLTVQAQRPIGDIEYEQDIAEAKRQDAEIKEREAREQAGR